MTPAGRRGVTVAKVRALLTALPSVEPGTSYGMPSFKLGGKFFARFRDDDTVLVLQLAAITERDILMQMDPRAFFFTNHYRDYPAVLIRLDQVPLALLKAVLREAFLSAGRAASARRPKRTPHRR